MRLQPSRSGNNIKGNRLTPNTGSGVLEVGECLPAEQHRARLDLHAMTTNAVFAQEGYDDW